MMMPAMMFTAVSVESMASSSRSKIYIQRINRKGSIPSGEIEATDTP
jgi:hypothetical protein